MDQKTSFCLQIMLYKTQSSFFIYVQSIFVFKVNMMMMMAWDSLMLIVENFLGFQRAENYADLINSSRIYEIESRYQGWFNLNYFGSYNRKPEKHKSKYLKHL